MGSERKSAGIGYYIAPVLFVKCEMHDPPRARDRPSPGTGALRRRQMFAVVVQTRTARRRPPTGFRLAFHHIRFRINL